MSAGRREIRDVPGESACPSTAVKFPAFDHENDMTPFRLCNEDAGTIRSVVVT
jgi:hypothetical protein